MASLSAPLFDRRLADGFCGAVGRTPLLRLRHLSEATGCEILGKAEFMNPGGSLKDRAALAMIEDAEASGALRPGGTIVEGTAGNTGVGLALCGLARGYRSLFIVPDNFSHEKTDLLKSFGAEVRRVPPKPYRDPENFQHIARRTAEGIAGGWWSNQFDNPANRAGHYRTTGPEMREQDGGARHRLRHLDRLRRRPGRGEPVPEGALGRHPHGSAPIPMGAAMLVVVQARSHRHR